eukprot:1339600-Pyramimonas_sp.AAC.1
MAMCRPSCGCRSSSGGRGSGDAFLGGRSGRGIIGPRVPEKSPWWGVVSRRMRVTCGSMAH